MYEAKKNAPKPGRVFFILSVAADNLVDQAASA